MSNNSSVAFVEDAKSKKCKGAKSGKRKHRKNSGGNYIILSLLCLNGHLLNNKLFMIV